MKNTIKILVALLLVVNFGCNDSDGRFFETETSGWVEFAPPTAARTVTPSTTKLGLTVNVNVPVYPNGLNIGYSLQAVQGDYTQYVSTGNNLYVEPANKRYPMPTIDLMFSNLDNNFSGNAVIFDVVLNSVDQDGVTVGVDANSIVKYRITIPCSIAVGTSYNASVTVADIGITDENNEDYDYVATLAQLTPNSWSIDSAWGPSFVANLTGNPTYIGQLVYPATLTLNANGTVTVLGTSANRPGGTGTYDTCSDTFVLTLNQATFTGTTWKVTTVLTPN